MEQIGMLAKDAYELEVQDACKALRINEKGRDVVADRESKLPPKMQAKKKKS